MISELVPAAGKSAALGQPNQFLPFRGSTLLGWVLTRHAAPT